jgi:hypothetical protein
MTTNFIVNFTFCAGSDDPEDTDRETFVCHIDAPTMLNAKEGRKKIAILSERANAALDPYLDEDEQKTSELDFTYEEGINVYTLVKGMNVLGKNEGISLEDAHEFVGNIAGVFDIEQWQ